MSAMISRRSVLTLAASGALAAGLSSCGKRHHQSESQRPADDPSDDPTDLESYGYDPDSAEPGHPETPQPVGHVPPAAAVDAEFLPPVGNQSMPNCYVWSSIYGLATFHAARVSNTPPTSPDLQAAPDYSYIRQEADSNAASNTCKGGQITKSLDWLKSNGGTPSLAAAPNHFKKQPHQACGLNWSEYHSQIIPPDPRFLITDYKLTQITGANGLDNLRTVITHGSPIVFGTKLYSDIKKYNGDPSPYVGNGQLAQADGKKVGHAMLIVGYDDNRGSGAVRIQNSWGKRWGDKGFMWMAYATLEKLAQGQGIYLA